MALSVAEEIQQLRALFWSDRDPEGLVFAPLADAYRRQGGLDEAIALLEAGLGRRGDFTPGHVVAGWVRRDRGERDAAERAFRAALALDDENAEATRGLAELIERSADDAPATPVAPAKTVADPSAAVGAPEVGGEPGGDDGPVTRTMADLYAGQGLHDRALRVYRRLLERDPSDGSLRQRIAELSASATGGGRGRDVDVEKLARDWAEGAGHTGELSTPFAWGPTEGLRARPNGPSAREYFRGLLAWKQSSSEPAAADDPPAGPTVVQVAAEPESEVVPIASLAQLEAPGGAVEIAALAPDQVAIASLAPDAVPIGSLAPDAVAIASLAPDAIPIASLAPDAVPIASLASSGWVRI